MQLNRVTILTGPDIADLLEKRETELMEIVERAYKAHAMGQSSVPHSVFLRFPDSESNRIIALPAWLGGGFDTAGVKWIASFPRNIDAGMDRASGVLILSSASTGQPVAMLEASIISAKRTAASAALAAIHLCRGRYCDRVGLVGCGIINFEVARFLHAAFPNLRGFTIADTDAARAAQFRERLQSEFNEDVQVTPSAASVLKKCRLTSIATNALIAHISDLSVCEPSSVILHISLRDITPEAMLSCENFVDDFDHVCRAQTSVHMAEQLTGSRVFIKGTLGELLMGTVAADPDSERIVVFSPFGLGILDLAVGQFVCMLGLEQGRGTQIPSFLPQSWTDTKLPPRTIR